MASMTAEQVVTELRKIRYGRPPSLQSLARSAGISRVTLYEVIKSGRPSAAVAQSLGKALQAVRVGAVRETPSSGR